MTSEEDSVVDLLARQYVHCYGHFGLPLARRPLREGLTLLLDSVRSGDTGPLLGTMRARFRVAKGRERNSFEARLSGDIGWLRERLGGTLEGRAVLELGCGGEQELRLVADSSRAASIVGVDPRITASTMLAGDRPTLALPSLFPDGPGPAAPVLPDVEVAIARFVLHHIPLTEQERYLRRLAQLLGARGVLYLVEDCPDPVPVPDGAGGSCPECMAACMAWNGLGPRARFACLVLNDLWSNCVAYGRGDEDQVHAFRAGDQWRALLGTVGLTASATVRLGFSHARLHGLPALRILAGPRRG